MVAIYHLLWNHKIYLENDNTSINHFNWN